MSMIALSTGLGATRLSGVIAPVIPLPQTLPDVVVPGEENTALSAPLSDTWTVSGSPATVILREYRLLLDGAVALGPQTGPVFTLPAGTAGQTYSYQVRVVTAEADGSFSAWTELGSSVVAHAPPQTAGSLPDLTLTVGDPARTYDLTSYFTGSDLTFSVQSGPLPTASSLVGPVLSIAAVSAFGPDTVVIRATNPGGTADQAFGVAVTSPATAPDPFQPADWTLDAPALTGVLDITVSALPSDGGAAITALEYQLDSGSFTPIGGSATGTYQITGLNAGQSYDVALRAVNSAGASAASASKTRTTSDVPAAFSADDWSLTDIGTGDDIRITISVLPDASGAPLTRLQHNIDAAGWIDFTTDPATGAFDILDVVSPGQTSQVTIRASNALGDAPASDIKTVTMTNGFALTPTPDNQIEINQAQGTITITVTSPAEYASYDAGNGAGVFVSSVSDLDTGPVALVPVQISQSSPVDAGDILTATPGLWIYDGDTSAPTITYRWLRDGVPISGATSSSYTAQEADAGASLTLEESATGANGTRMTVSAAVSVARPILLTDGFDVADGYTSGQDIPATSANWSILTNEGNTVATINPLGVAEISGGASDDNIRIAYTGVTTDDQAIEVEIDSIQKNSNRADATLFVRGSGAGLDDTMIRAFFRSSTDELILSEHIDGSLPQIDFYSGVPLSSGDVVRLEVTGTTSNVLVNGATVATMNGITVTGGQPGWGAYLANDAENIVSYRSAQVENI